MARAELLVQQDIMREVLGRYLDLKALALFELVSSHAKTSVKEGTTWLESACKALPRFRLDSNLLELPQRVTFAGWLPPLLRVSVAPELTVPLQGVKEAERLSKLLSAAERKSASHLAGGGERATLFIGQLRFPADEIQEALDEDLGRERPLVDPVTCLGAPIWLRAKGCDLQLHFAMQHGKLFVSARDDDLPSDLIELTGRHSLHQGFEDHLRGSLLTLDMHGVSPAFTLHFKGIIMPLNGPWQAASSGIFAATRGKAVAVEALASGVPCMVHCRDGAIEQPTHLAHTLHLDTVRR